MDGNPKQQLVERLKQANNVLVTVSANPSVDQLAACIGLTLVLNHMDKHATAVFSGEPPSTLEFLKPEETLEKNTDSLRDFIISLDKSKADKLRYKVEDKVVKIFITPYRTSISDQDLVFSQGDFNVDVVVALGVQKQEDLDHAITSHGRILHDATVATISTAQNAELGSINWTETRASSLSELVVQLADLLDKKAMDAQIATALLTGIVAATDRFSNDKTSPQAMSASAELMSAGANQQLIANKLEEPAPLPAPPAGQKPQSYGGAGNKPKKEPGELDIDHDNKQPGPPAEPLPQPNVEPQPQVHIDEHGQLTTLGEQEEHAHPTISNVHGVSREGRDDHAAAVPGEEPEDTLLPDKSHEHGRMTEPPSMGGRLTASADDDDVDTPTDALTLPAVNTPILSHDKVASEPPQKEEQTAPLEPPDEPEHQPKMMDYEPTPTEPTPPSPTPPPPAPRQFPPPPPPPAPAQNVAPTGPPAIVPDETLADIEKSVDSPHSKLDATDTAAPNVDDARSAVEAALNAGVTAPPKPAAFNSLPLGNSDLRPAAGAQVPPNSGVSEPTPGNTPADMAMNFPPPPGPAPGSQPAPPSAFPGTPPDSSQNGGMPPAPPVPPPIIPQ